MPHFQHIRHAALTDVGRKRKNNEDSFGEFPAMGVFCVADGMGGGDDGEVASAAVVHGLEAFAAGRPLPDAATYPVDELVAGVKSAVSGASKWIFERAKSRGLKGCGSTFVGVCFDASRPSSAVALHAGDSRLYRIRGKSIRQVTKDHSAAELIGAKDEDDINPMFRGMILRAVGIQPSVELDATPFDVREGDVVVICSDGLYRMVPEKKMVSIVREAGTPEKAVRSLVDAANAAGGIDNVTAVVAEVGPLPDPLPTVAMPPPDDAGRDENATAGEEPVTRNTQTSASFDFDPITDAKSEESPGDTSNTARRQITIPEEAERESDKGATDAPAQNPPPAAAFGSPALRRKLFMFILPAVGVVLAIVAAVCVASAQRRTREAERIAAERAEAERIAAEKAEAERIAAEKAEAERIAAEKAEAERIAAEKAEAERIAAEKAEAERIAAEKAEAERIAAERAEAERIAAEKAEAERIAAEKAEAERIAAEKAEAERIAAEKAEAERIAAEKRAEAERIVAEKKAEAERIAAEKANLLEKVRPMLDDAWFYCDSEEPKQAMLCLKAANEAGYLLTRGEYDRIRESYGKKRAYLSAMLKSRNVASEDRRREFASSKQELDDLFTSLKSEKAADESAGGDN